MNQNQLIVTILDTDGNELRRIECNRIESAYNSTLIYGICEGGIYAYDILLASIPSSKTVFVDSIEKIKK